MGGIKASCGLKALNARPNDLMCLRANLLRKLGLESASKKSTSFLKYSHTLKLKFAFVLISRASCADREVPRCKCGRARFRGRLARTNYASSTSATTQKEA